MRVAHTVAERSLCDRDQVGAVVVDRSNRIVDTGYNGPPRGMYVAATPTGSGGLQTATCTSWCPRAKNLCGDRSIHPPHGLCTGLPNLLHPEYDDCHSIHAEANALLFGERTQREGGTIYITSGVCGACAKLIANSGLVRVVVDLQGSPAHRSGGEWHAWLELCGVKCEVFDVTGK